MKPFFICAFVCSLSALGQQNPSAPIQTGNINTQRGGVTVVGSHDRLVLGQVGPVHMKRDVRSAALDEAVRLHAQVEGYRFISEYKQNPSYNPLDHSDQLLTPGQLMALDQLLSGLKRYVESLVDVNEGTSYYSLDDAVAAKSLSTLDLGDLGLDSVVKLKQPIQILAQYLAQTTKPKRKLDIYISSMDPSINQICDGLIQTILILMGRSEEDFRTEISREDMTIRSSGGTISSDERDRRMRNLPMLSYASTEVQERLRSMRKSLIEIELAHHAMAAHYMGNDRSVSFTESILGLLAPSQNL